MTELDDALKSSTDPAFIRRQLAPADGHTRRAQSTKRDLLKACRRLLMDGDFRPSMAACCDLARRAQRSGYGHFGTIDGLLTEALQDGVVRDCIAVRVIGADMAVLSIETRDRIVRAVVMGGA